MAVTTGIGWCHHTMNFWWGCTKVSKECRRCHIAAIMKRAGISDPFAGPIRRKNWSGPDKWNRAARREGTRRRVFTCSMSDFFHVEADEWRSEVWQLIRDCESLDWIVLTKRSQRIAACLPPDRGNGYPNVWLGVTCGHSDSYYRLQDLKAVPASIKFVSAEPLLEPLDFTTHLSRLDWMITGCEQAEKADRIPMNLDWVRDIDQQCRDFSKAHYFKQYYVNDTGRPATDGMLDGVQRQAWPTPAVV